MSALAALIGAPPGPSAVRPPGDAAEWITLAAASRPSAGMWAP